MAGLLDALFDPSFYSGAGGLLSRLSPMVGQMPQSQGFGPENPIAIGGYQMPRIGDAAQFTPAQPDPAALPPNAQPAQGQLPMQQPMAQPDIGDRFLSGIRALGNPDGLLNRLADAGSAFAGGSTRANQTAQFLVSKGVDPAMAQTIVSDPRLLRSVLPSLIGGGKTNDITEYQFAKTEEPNLTFQQFMNRKKATSGEYGMQPIWGTGPDGKPAVLQLGKSGDAKQSVLPPGFSLARDPIKVEGPTGTTILDPQTRQPVQFIPKDVSGAAKAKELGEAEGQALANLPTTIATAETALKTIRQLEEHPGKKNWGAFGIGAVFPDVPGTATRGFGALVDQVKGQNFMTAFQSLKGAGAITEQEGAKAERAQARLDRAQSEADFDIALKDLKEVITAGMERARQKAGVKGGQAAPNPANDLKKKYGLD